MLTDDAKATLLLTGRFGKQDRSSVKPLSPTEWGRFAAWLYSKGAAPRDLLASGAGDLLASWTDRRVTRNRVDELLGRGVAMSLSLDKWQSAGLWVMTRSDNDYPRALKTRLREASPPVLFGCGERALLRKGGIAVVGSRDAVDAALEDTRRLARTAAHDGIAVVSGGARGIDETAMTAALEAGGVAVGVLANNLLRASTSAPYRQALRAGHLALVSPFQPEARFLAGNAMARNKYIYCLADAAVVIATAHESGGTWAGAVENLKKGWVPLFIRRAAVPGHEALVDAGARWLPDKLENLDTLIRRADVERAERMADRADPAAAGATEKSTEADSLDDSASGRGAPSGSQQNAQVDCASDGCAAVGDAAPTGEPGPFYQLFVDHLRSQLQCGPADAKTLAERLDLPKTLVDRWLKQAVKDGVASKEGKPVKFHLLERADSQQSLF